MSQFTGFPRKLRQTPVPNVFFSAVLPFIDDLVELKVTLFLFHRISLKRGYPRFVTAKELAADLDLMAGLALGDRDPAEELARGLRMAVERGTLLTLTLERAEGADHLYFLNTEADRRAIEAVRRGEVDLGALPRVDAVPATPDHRNIYALYEENIGPLSPLLMEELKEAEELYPYHWIVEAFREAVRMNRRRWRYIQRILEHWRAEGRPHGEAERRPQTAPRGPRRGGGYILRRRGR